MNLRFRAISVQSRKVVGCRGEDGFAQYQNREEALRGLSLSIEEKGGVEVVLRDKGTAGGSVSEEVRGKRSSAS